MAVERTKRKVRLPAETAELIRGLHPGVKRKVRYALDAILEDPDVGKALKGDLTGLRSYRVGRFRIVYRLSPRRIVEGVAVGPRRGIYEMTYRLVRREGA